MLGCLLCCCWLMLGCKDDFNEFYANEGIGRRHAVKNDTTKKSIVERVQQVLLEIVRCMLSNAGLGKGIRVKLL